MPIEVATPVVEAPALAPAPPPVSSPAPAAESTPALTAAEQAVNGKDFDRFKRARHAEREGKPLQAKAPATEPTSPPVKAATPAAPAPAVERRVSNRQLEQNEAIRRAVDAATADLRAEVTRLKGGQPPAVTPPAVAAAVSDPTDPEPDPTNAETYPDGQFDRKYLKDQARWEARQELKERDQQIAVARTQHERLQAFSVAAAKTKDAIQAAIKADPAFAESVDHELLALKPSVALQPGEDMTFGHMVADWLLATPHPAQLLKHLSNRAEVARLAALSPIALFREQGKIESTFTSAAPKPAAAAPAQAPTPSVEPPAITLGRKPVESVDPITSSLRSGDFTAYQAAKRAAGKVHFAG